MRRTWESLIGWHKLVIRVPRTRWDPHQLALPLPPTNHQLTNNLTMSCSNLRDAVPFQFLSGRVARETITPWDCHKFSCAWADSTVTYPMDTEVLANFIFPFVGD